MPAVSIRILPPEVSSRIAAGEVVERPSSIVKELVENALDAGATRISVEANEGGVALIRVVDDGCGIEPDELPLAFSRHATSKLQPTPTSTPSTPWAFAAKRCPASPPWRTSRRYRASTTPRKPLESASASARCSSRAPPAPRPGTSFSVRSLFREQPARLKFLRSAGAEASQNRRHRQPLRPGLPGGRLLPAASMASESFATIGSGSRREAAAGVYGRDVAASMLEAHRRGRGLPRRGAVHAAAVTRASRAYITFFINRRWVRSRALTYAVEEAYSGMLQVGPFPHRHRGPAPAARGGRRQRPSRQSRGTLAQRARRSSPCVQRPIRRALSGLAPVGSEPADWLAASGSGAEPASPSRAPPQPDAPLQSQLLPQDAPTAFEQALLPASVPIMRPLGQAGTTYVIAEGPAGLYLIDQHAAHERVLFEQFLDSLTRTAGVSQPLLAPLMLELTPAQASLVTSFAPQLREHGFEVEPFGPGGFLLRAAPASLRRDDPARAFVELLDLLTREDSPADPRRRVAASLACHAAVRAGQTLAMEEMRDLIRAAGGLRHAADLPSRPPHHAPPQLRRTGPPLQPQVGGAIHRVPQFSRRFPCAAPVHRARLRLGGAQQSRLPRELRSRPARRHRRGRPRPRPWVA